MDKYLGSFLRTFNPFGPFMRLIQQLNGRKDISLFDDFKNIGGFLTQKLGNQIGDTLVDTAGSYIGANMAPKDVQAAELQLHNQRTLRQTEFQDAIGSMRSAGLNPALLYGSGANTSAGSAQVSNTAGSLSDLIALATLPAQLKLLKAQTNKTDADANKAESETKGQDISNEFAAALNQSALDSQKVARDLSRSQMSEINARIDTMEKEREKIVSDILKNTADIALSNEKLVTESTIQLLNRANAFRIAEMLPYEKLFMQAKTDAERSSASLSAAQAAYQNGLIDHGYIETTCKILNAESSIKDVEAALKNPNYEYKSNVLDKFGRYFTASLSAALSPIKGILSF